VTQAKLSGPRIVALGAVVVLFVVGVAWVLGVGGRYKVHALFADASQLVQGDLVEVGAKPVGKVGKIRLTDDNLADVELDITDDEYKPLRAGAVARVRQVGQIGVTNRFVELDPGPSSAPEIPDGGTLPATQTRPNVDIDLLIDALDPETRGNLKKLIQKNAVIFDGRTHSANRAFEYLNPGFAQLRAVADELGRDTGAIDRLVRTGAAAAGALASRRTDLQEGIGNTAGTLRAIAAESGALGALLSRAPATMRQGRATLGRLDQTLAVLNPALTELRPSAAPLARLLRVLPGAASRVTPALADLRAILPPVAEALRTLPALSRAGVPALRSSTSAIRASLPVFRIIRPYAPEALIAISNGFGGETTGGYDANGHFIKIVGGNQFGPGGFTGPFGALPNLSTGDFSGFRSGLTERCPGGAADPAPDGSSPWIVDSSLCDPKDNQR
jgi:phospholipid/cholesterol/gamma-HCH transport system substrate-binding protein